MKKKAVNAASLETGCGVAPETSPEPKEIDGQEYPDKDDRDPGNLQRPKPIACAGEELLGESVFGRAGPEPAAGVDRNLIAKERGKTEGQTTQRRHERWRVLFESKVARFNVRVSSSDVDRLVVGRRLLRHARKTLQGKTEDENARDSGRDEPVIR
jgi:hypothetical protein